MRPDDIVETSLGATHNQEIEECLLMALTSISLQALNSESSFAESLEVFLTFASLKVISSMDFPIV
jgi:hypothetical protein